MRIPSGSVRLLALAVFTPLVLAGAPDLSDSDRASAFRAAGFTQKGGHWRSACEDPGTPSYTPGVIETVRDLNGDGRPEAVVTEGGTYCYGHTGTGFTMVSKQTDGTWKAIHSAPGMARFLTTKGRDGWPDLLIGGPGFCFPVLRWDGRAYRLQRHEYEGKPCRPG
jgi:hypothetical protein